MKNLKMYKREKAREYREKTTVITNAIFDLHLETALSAIEAFPIMAATKTQVKRILSRRNKLVAKIRKFKKELFKY